MQKTTTYGFTIVELLIVVVVIAILAAITLVTYSGIQDRARVSSVRTTISQTDRQIKAYATLNNDTYPAESNFSSAIGGSAPSDASIVYLATAGATSPKKYCVSATSTAKSSISYASTQDTTGIQGRCVRNYVPNASAETATGIAWNTPSLVGVSGGHAASPTGIFGTNADRFTFMGTGSANSNGFGPYQLVTGLNATTSYSTSVWMRSSKPMDYRIALELRDASSTRFSTVYSTNTTLVAGQWTRLSFVLPPTANLDRMTFCVYGGYGSLVDGDYVEVDGFMATPATESYGYATGTESSWTFDGTVNASTSFGPAIRI